MKQGSDWRKSAMSRLAILWENKAISFHTKIKFYKSLDLSMLLSGWESWTLTVDLERRIQAIENNVTVQGRILCVSYREHKTNEHVCNRSIPSQDARSFNCQPSSVGYHGSATSVVVIGSRNSGGSRRRGRPCKSWKDNINEWTDQSMSSLLHITDDRGRWTVMQRMHLSEYPTTPGHHGY